MIEFTKVSLLGICFYGMGYLVMRSRTLEFLMCDVGGRIYFPFVVGAAIIVQLSALLLYVGIYSVELIVTVLITAAILPVYFNRNNIFDHEKYFEFFLVLLLLILFLFISDFGVINFRIVSLYLTETLPAVGRFGLATNMMFGEPVKVALLYSTDAIRALVTIFAIGDRTAYYSTGIIALNAGICILTLIGSLCFLKRFFPLIMTPIIGISFYFTTLGSKLVSARGETIGWMFGFAYLCVFTDVVRLVVKNKDWKGAVLPAILASILFIAAMGSHGLVGLVIACISLGIFVYELIATQEQIRKAIIIIGMITTFSLVGFGSIYVMGFGGGGSWNKNFELSGHTPDPGAEDPALAFDFQFLRKAPATDIIKVKEKPPYIAQSDVFWGFAALSIKNTTDQKGILGGKAHYFAERISNNVQNNKEDLFKLLSLNIFIILIAFMLPSKRYRNYGSLVLGGIFLLIFTGLYAAYLNSITVSTYPLGSLRRVIRYLDIFYCMGVIIVVAECTLIIANYFSKVAANKFEYFANEKPRMFLGFGDFISKPAIILEAFLLIVSAFFVWYFVKFNMLILFFIIIGIEIVRKWRLFVEDKACRNSSPIKSIKLSQFYNDKMKFFIIATYFYIAIGAVLFTFGVKVTDRHKQYDPKYFVEAVRYLNNSGKIGTYVISNEVDENIFNFLLTKSISVSEALFMYQIHDAMIFQKDEIIKLKNFLQTGNREYIKEKNLAYLFIYKRRSRKWYHAFPLSVKMAIFKKDDLYKNVFENDAYIIYKIVANI